MQQSLNMGYGSDQTLWRIAKYDAIIPGGGRFTVYNCDVNGASE